MKEEKEKETKSTRKSFSSPATGYNCYSSWRANRIEFQFGHRPPPPSVPLPPPSTSHGNRQQVTTVQRNLISFRECMNVGHGARGGYTGCAYIHGGGYVVCKWRIVGRSLVGLRGAFKWNQLSRIIIMRAKETARFESRKLFWRYSYPASNRFDRYRFVPLVMLAEMLENTGIDNWEITVEGWCLANMFSFIADGRMINSV